MDKKEELKEAVNPMIEFNEHCANVQQCLDGALPFELQAEVVTYALKTMKETPTLSISEAILLGFEEFVK